MVKANGDAGSLPTKGEPPPIERVKLADLHPHPRNYQKHPEDQITHIRASLRLYGQFRPILTANDLTILAGHGLAESMGREEMVDADIRRYPFGPDDPTALKLLALDNELNNLAEVDDRLLTEMLRDIASADVDGLLGTGFDDDMLANLLFVTRAAQEIGDRDEAAAWVGMPEFAPAADETILTLRFDNEDERQKALVLLGLEEAPITRGKRMWSAWWPARDRDDPRHAVFTTEAPADAPADAPA